MMSHLRECAACRKRLQLANAFFEAHADVSHDESRGSGDVRPVAAVHTNRASVRDGAAMHVALDDDFGTEHDSEAKTAARFYEFVGRLHKQKQQAIHGQSTAWMRRWLPAAAAVLLPLLIVGLTFSRMQTVVRAEELLSRASHYERSLPADRVGRVSIALTSGILAFAPAAGGVRPAQPRMAPFRVVRDVTGGIALDTWPDGAASGEYAPLDQALARHGFEKGEPLGLDGVHAWRASLSEKHDEVFDRGGLLVLRTTTPEGTLREVELTVRRHDYHVIKLALVFEGIGRLEIREIEESVRRAVKAVTPGAAAPAGTTASAPALAARAAAAAATPTPVTPAPVARTLAAQPGLSRWLDRTFGTTPDRNTFVPDLQRLMTEVRQQLGALDTLARRYPEEEVEQQWANADRADLRRRVDKAYSAISRDLNVLDLRVGILFGSSNRSAPVMEAPPDWRRRAARALAHAEAMDREIRQLLTYDDIPAAGTRAADGTSAPRVLSTLDALWDVVHTPAGGPSGER